MRIRVHILAVIAVLVISLLLPPAFGVSAQEIASEPAVAVAPTQTPDETIAPTEPAETIPAETAPTIQPANEKSAIYKLCDNMAQNMQARQILVFDTNTDTILYTKSVDGGKLFPASITKLFSAYVALQYLEPDTIITAGDELDLVHEGSSLAYVPPGSQVRVRMLVEGMMLPSGNDAAMVMAAAAGRAIAGDEALPGKDAVQTFVDEMNRQADALGFEKSHFSNPDGWHAGSHYTCLNDLARIAKLALGNETMRCYMGLYKDDTYYVSGHHVIWENNNLLLHPEAGYYHTDAIGMKTGYTRPAGYSLMSAFTFEDGEIVVGLFGYTSKYDRFLDAIHLAQACKDQLRLEAALQEEIRANPGVG